MKNKSTGKTLITIMATDGRVSTAATFYVKLDWLALDKKDIKKTKKFFPRDILSITISDELHSLYLPINK